MPTPRIDWSTNRMHTPKIIASGTSRFGRRRSLLIGMTNSMPINSQNAVPAMLTRPEIPETLGAIFCTSGIAAPVPRRKKLKMPMPRKDNSSSATTAFCSFAKISTPIMLTPSRINRNAMPMTGAGIIGKNSSCSTMPHMEISTEQESRLTMKYADRFDRMLGPGPKPTSVYCPRPPSTSGIRLCSSVNVNAWKMLSTTTTAIAMTKLLPAMPMPRPSDNRQLVATIRPTQVEIALGNPNFFVVACIKIPPKHAKKNTKKGRPRQKLCREAPLLRKQ